MDFDQKNYERIYQKNNNKERSLDATYLIMIAKALKVKEIKNHEDLNKLKN